MVRLIVREILAVRHSLSRKSFNIYKQVPSTRQCLCPDLNTCTLLLRTIPLSFKNNKWRHLNSTRNFNPGCNLMSNSLQVVFSFPQCHCYCGSWSSGFALSFFLSGLGRWYGRPGPVMVHLTVHLVAAGQDARNGWPQVRPAELLHQMAVYSTDQQ